MSAVEASNTKKTLCVQTHLAMKLFLKTPAQRLHRHVRTPFQTPPLAQWQQCIKLRGCGQEVCELLTLDRTLAFKTGRLPECTSVPSCFLEVSERAKRIECAVQKGDTNDLCTAKNTHHCVSANVTVYVNAHRDMYLIKEEQTYWKCPRVI